MFTKKTWLVRFVHRDGNVELNESRTLDWARMMFDTSYDTDTEIYSEIQLIERDWTKDENNCDTIIDRKVFG